MLQRRQILANGIAAGAMFPYSIRAQPMDLARVICGFPPGGSTDAVSRQVAERLRGAYAGAVLVDNKPGAGGRLAIEELKRSAPDGKVMLMTPSTVITLYPQIYKKLTYEPQDLTPVSAVAQLQLGWGVGPLVPKTVDSLKGFLEWCKAHPEHANYGTPGSGSPTHFLGALLAKASGVPLGHVPYKGTAQCLQDLLGGQLAAMSSPVGDFLPYLKDGRLRLLATSDAKRSRFAPDVPTCREQGFRDLVLVQWYGFFLPAKAPPATVERLASAIKASLDSAALVEAFARFGLETFASTPAETARMIRNDMAQWAPIVKAVGFTPED